MVGCNVRVRLGYGPHSGPYLADSSQNPQDAEETGIVLCISGCDDLPKFVPYRRDSSLGSNCRLSSTIVQFMSSPPAIIKERYNSYVTMATCGDKQSEYVLLSELGQEVFVVCLDAVTGQPRWTNRFAPMYGGFSGDPNIPQFLTGEVYGNRLLVEAGNGYSVRIGCFNKDTGHLLLSFDTGIFHLPD